MNEPIEQSLETQGPTKTPTEDLSTKERFFERIGWVKQELERLRRGDITDDIFAANIALEIEARETETKKKSHLIEALRDQIYRDGLVEAESEESFQMYLDELNKNSECFGLVLGDIDHFGDVNAEAGHEKADSALIAVTERMSQSLRFRQTEESEVQKSDRLFRRHGDEFAIVVRNLTPDDQGKKQLKDVMERVREAVASKPIELDIRGVPTQRRITVSLGGAVISNAIASEPAEFIHLVDTQGLYQAKGLGRNATFVVNFDQPNTLAA